jgi:putative endonuclease
MNYFVYILRSVEFNKTYVGITSNPERRIAEHNSGKSNFTSKYKPWKLVYTEEVSDRIVAREREKYFKSAAGRKQIKKMLE